jgi:hypothetical protein
MDYILVGAEVVLEEVLLTYVLEFLDLRSHVWGMRE